MKALVLEEKKKLVIRDISIEEEMGPDDIRIKMDVVGICGSDIHYYEHGKIGPFVVESPMVLGHEGAGFVEEVGRNVRHIKKGDRVCMEPGIPTFNSRETLLGLYNLDPDVKFWATPPIHGILRPYVVHPAAFSYVLSESVSNEEGALVEPLAIGVHSAKKAKIQPGDVGVVIGTGTIGMVTIKAALASGCSKVIAVDVIQNKLDIATTFGPVIPVNPEKEDVLEVINRETAEWGADVIFEASGNDKAARDIFNYARPGGKVVCIGMPAGGIIPMDIVTAQSKEISIETIFRYANVFNRAVDLMSSGEIDVKPLITDAYSFNDSIEAFTYAANPSPESVKVQIKF
jgi:D-xylulose reductase